MESTFTVLTPAATTALTTLERLKAQLSITTTDEDDYLTGEIDSVSAFICNELNVLRAEDGTATIGRETLVETIRLSRYSSRLLCSRSSQRQDCLSNLLLARKPIVSVTSVVENDVTLTPDTDYIIEANQGILIRLASDLETQWPTGKIVVTYVAGWLLPGDSGRNLPFPIEDAIFGLLKADRFTRTRDPTLRSENFISGLYGYTLFDASTAMGGKSGRLPPDIDALLAPYRNIIVH